MGDISFIKTDDLALDFVSAIENNIGMDIKVKEAILTADHIHTSTHGHYRDYYDAEALELVAHKDRLIFELFEYERE